MTCIIFYNTCQSFRDTQCCCCRVHRKFPGILLANSGTVLFLNTSKPFNSNMNNDLQRKIMFWWNEKRKKPKNNCRSNTNLHRQLRQVNYLPTFFYANKKFGSALFYNSLIMNYYYDILSPFFKIRNTYIFFSID